MDFVFIPYYDKIKAIEYTKSLKVHFQADNFTKYLDIALNTAKGLNAKTVVAIDRTAFRLIGCLLEEKILRKLVWGYSR